MTQVLSGYKRTKKSRSLHSCARPYADLKLSVSAFSGLKAVAAATFVNLRWCFLLIMSSFLLSWWVKRITLVESSLIVEFTAQADQLLLMNDADDEDWETLLKRSIPEVMRLYEWPRLFQV
jgi:hypothetical protein